MRNVDGAAPGGGGVLRGRPSATRAEWERAREADAADLNRLLGAGGEVEAYVVPLWSDGDAERCLAELRGFDDARIYVISAGDDLDGLLGALAETEFGLCGEALPGLGPLIHAAASLDLPLLLPGVDPAGALRALALAIADDLSPREIETLLRGGGGGEPDAESVARARDLLG